MLLFLSYAKVHNRFKGVDCIQRFISSPARSKSSLNEEPTSVDETTKEFHAWMKQSTNSYEEGKFSSVRKSRTMRRSPKRVITINVYETRKETRRINMNVMFKICEHCVQNFIERGEVD